ncbi:MAG: hypothetical protein H7268_12390 [Sandarakinorhabdus sp.]|nr:hypothetical protein [Sandarakinorhabdus sp.]
MTGIYIHSSNSVRAILQSGEMRGSTKEMQKLGATAEQLGLADNQLHTLFVEWRVGDVAESVSRLTVAKGDVRGVMVFRLPPALVENVGGYPAVIGGHVDLALLGLRALLVSSEDLASSNTSWDAMQRLIRPYCGSTFAFDAEDIAKIKDGRYIKDFVLSALNGGALA